MKFLFFALLTILSINIFGQNNQRNNADKTDAKKKAALYKKNKIRQSDSYSYNYKFGEMEKQGGHINTTTYNSDGQPLSVIRYGDKGDTIDKQVYLYDNFKNCIQMTTTSGSVQEKILYKFDTNHNPIEVREYNNNSLMTFTKSRYDSIGNTIEKLDYATDGTVGIKIVYVYNDKGCNTEVLAYVSNGTLKERLVCNYDPNCNEIKEMIYDEDGTVEDKNMTFEYDKSGNQLEVAKWDRLWSEKKTRSAFIYDDQNRLITENRYYNRNKSGGSIIYKYDSNGLLIGTTFTNVLNEPTLTIKMTYK